MNSEDDAPGGGEAKGDVEAEEGSTDAGAERAADSRYGVEEMPDGDLLLAAVTGDRQGMLEALARGADVNYVDQRYGWPMLYWAAQKKMSVSVLILLVAGADPNARGFGEETPLHAAARWGDLGSIAALLRHGARIDAGDGKRRTPLFHAAHYGRFLAAYLLLACGADASIGSTGRGAATPSQTATKRNHREIARLLGERSMGEKSREMMKRYGFSGGMAEDAANLAGIVERYIVDYGPKPLRNADVRDEVMDLAIWRKAEREKPPGERWPG